MQRPGRETQIHCTIEAVKHHDEACVIMETEKHMLMKDQASQLTEVPQLESLYIGMTRVKSHVIRVQND